MYQIPTTRAISPKLGRNKITNSAVNSSSEGGVSLNQPVNQNQKNSNKGCEKDVSDSKKPIRKSQLKLHSQEAAASKTESKPAKTKKPKSTSKERPSQKEGHIESEQSNGMIDQDSETNASENNAQVLIAAAAQEIMPQEVAVGV